MIKQSSQGTLTEHLISALTPEGVISPPTIPESPCAKQGTERGRELAKSHGGKWHSWDFSPPSGLGAHAHLHPTLRSPRKGSGPARLRSPPGVASRQRVPAHPAPCFVGSPVIRPLTVGGHREPQSCLKNRGFNWGWVFVSSGTLGNVWGHFGLTKLVGGCYWHPVGRSQGCC